MPSLPLVLRMKQPVKEDDTSDAIVEYRLFSLTFMIADLSSSARKLLSVGSSIYRCPAQTINVK
jgi:hypothetical protein